MVFYSRIEHFSRHLPRCFLSASSFLGGEKEKIFYHLRTVDYPQNRKLKAARR